MTPMDTDRRAFGLLTQNKADCPTHLMRTACEVSNSSIMTKKNVDNKSFYFVCVCLKEARLS